MEWKTVAVGAAVGCGALLALKKYCGGPSCSAAPKLNGKVAIVTGANTGIGYETAWRLAQLGAIVVAAVRDMEKGNAAVQSLQQRGQTIGQIECMRLDLASLASVREFVNEFTSKYSACHLLINNAGVMMCPYMKTQDGFEMQFGTNHLGHFLLTNLLLPALSRGKARVVNVSSSGHNFAPKCGIDFDHLDPGPTEYRSVTAYGQSKIANILFTKELQRRFGTEISAYALHPGGVRTELARHFNPLFMYLVAPVGYILMKSPVQGAQTSLHCALAEEGTAENQVQPGMYYKDCARAVTNPIANDSELAKKLWEVSEVLVGLRS